MTRAPEIRSVLSSEWQKRKLKNKGYSLRSYARALKVSPGYLCMLLNGKRPFTEPQIHKLCDSLSLPEIERQRLIADFKLSQATSESESRYYRERLNEVSDKKDPFVNLKEKDISLFARWYYPAIRELWIASRGKLTSETISKRLRLPLLEAQVALMRLKEAGLLKEEVCVTSGTIRSETIRNFHKAVLDRAKEAVTNQKQEERQFSSMTLLIAPEKIAEAKKRITQFRKSMAELASEKVDDDVYALNVQFFSLE